MKLGLNETNLKFILDKADDRSEQVSDKNGAYKCDQCDFRTKRKFNLYRHNISKHTDKSEFSNTIKTTENKVEKAPDNLECDVCEYTTFRPLSLKMHKEMQHSGKQSLKPKNPTQTSPLHPGKAPPGFLVLLKCNLCDFKTEKKSNLERHISRHKGVEPMVKATAEVYVVIVVEHRCKMKSNGGGGLIAKDRKLSSRKGGEVGGGNGSGIGWGIYWGSVYC